MTYVVIIDLLKYIYVCVCVLYMGIIHDRFCVILLVYFHVALTFSLCWRISSGIMVLCKYILCIYLTQDIKVHGSDIQCEYICAVAWLCYGKLCDTVHIYSYRLIFTICVSGWKMDCVYLVTSKGWFYANFHSDYQPWLLLYPRPQ